MDFASLIRKTRSYRRFDEGYRLDREQLLKLVDYARLSPSAVNLQPLKYLLSYSATTNDLIFPELKWAGYLADWDGPSPGERPAAYLVVLGDTSITSNMHFEVNAGIAAQSILLGATAANLGGCLFGAVNRDNLRRKLKIDAKYQILYVIAIGKPVETVVLEETGANGSIKYYRDANGIHYVPKRPLTEVVLE